MRRGRVRAFVLLIGVMLGLPAQAGDLLARAGWISFVDSAGTPKLMLAVPDDMHPVFVYIFCEPGSGMATWSLDLDRLPRTHSVPVTLRVGPTEAHRDGVGQAEGPTAPYLEFALPLRHPLWDALATQRSLVVITPALPRAQRVSLKGIAEPLRHFRAACRGTRG